MSRISFKSEVAVTHTHASYDPCVIREVHGSWGGAAATYLQLHDARDLPADTAVPKMEWKLAAGASFDFIMEIPCTEGAVFCFSSTSGTKTIVTGGGNTGSFYIVGTEMTSAAVETVTGDLTTGVDAKEVWADSAGPKHLLKLEVKSSSASNAYAMIFPWDSPTGDQVPVCVIPVPAGETVTVYFGDGFSPRTFTAANVRQDACQVYMSSVATGLTATSSTEFCIRATYK